MKLETTPSFPGLTQAEALARQAQFGKNELPARRRNHLLESLWNVAREPMFILLAAACALYFFLGEWTETLLMFLSILFVAGIEIFQETKSERALELLREYTRAPVQVLRDGLWTELPSEELVPGDVVRVGEGDRVPADGNVLQTNDLAVEEAVLTGESLPVEKTVFAGAREAMTSSHRLATAPTAQLFQGTTVSGGQGIFKITATGAATELGKLGKSIEAIEPAPTPLQVQIERFVRGMGWVGAAAFALVLGLNFWLEHDLWKALLFSLTVAMALIPEEIPVAFSTFMALGAMRLMRSGILAKQPKTVESLGSATVICLDKTGTITENQMSVAETADWVDAEKRDRVLNLAWFASEPEPLDAMERAIQIQIIGSAEGDPRTGFSLKKEYALGGKPPMMTHVWENAATGQRIIAAKGAVERVLAVCEARVSRKDAKTQRLDKQHFASLRLCVTQRTEAAAEQGYRVLGVAIAEWPADQVFPENQDDFDWKFAGTIAFFDPPKANAAEVFQQFQTAGIRVVMITGDHAATARNIARTTNLLGWEISMTGAEVMDLEENALRDAVARVNVFARMFPEAKLRVVNALKANGETVAMSGDGVNDGPALKAAQIGVAMGKRGADIAKSAASLVLLNDNLADMVAAVGQGRRIYANLRKAIRYIISIHLPIVLVVLVPLLFGWQYPHILLPLHVIFLELVMDPIAAIAFENEPAEPNLLRKPPRVASASLFSWREIGAAILQGAVISAGILFAQQFAVGKGLPENTVRSFVFATLVFSNVFLTLCNRSFEQPIWRTIFYKNNLLPLILGISLVMLAAVLYVPFVAGMFRLHPLPAGDLAWCAGVAAVCVGWIEVWKIWRTKFGSRKDAKTQSD